MRRYRQPDPARRSTARLVGRALGWVAIVVLVLAVGGVAGVYLWLHEDVVAAVQARSADVKSAKQFLGDVPAPGHAAIALVIGYDHRANEAGGTPSRSDTVMLLRTDPETESISMLSFPRDMIVSIHCPGQAPFTQKINAAYANCGAKGTVQTVHDLIGLPINYLITVNFRGFKQVVNKLGGVWIDIDRRYYNDNAGLSPTFGYAKINLQPGYQLLTGGSALDYVRYRHTDSDFYRVARQQQFVKAVKYRFAHNFSLLKAPGIIRALVKNMEVASGGGGDVSGKTILSYARFILGLPPGHFFQTQIEGLTGYADLRTDPSNIQTAVQDWLTPDVEAASVATSVALGQKVKTKTPAPDKTTITVLNGNGVAGSAGSAGYALSQRGYRILQPPPNATGNAPSFGYFHTTVYWDPHVKQSKAAASSVAKLFAPADVKRMPSRIAPLGNSAMVVVVVGQTFKGSIAPAPPSRTPTKREPAHVVSNPYDSRGAAPRRAEEGSVPADVADGDRELVRAGSGEAAADLPGERLQQGRTPRLPYRRRDVLGDRADRLDRRPRSRRPQLPARPRRASLRLLLQRLEAAHDRAPVQRGELLGHQLAARQPVKRDDDRNRQRLEAAQGEVGRCRSRLTRMARIAFFGAGYAGLVSAVCLAELGHTVVLRDIAEERIAALKAGRVPFFEPGLEELIAANADRLSFTLSMEEAVADSEFLFVCVGTPPTHSGDADLSAVWSVIDELPQTIGHAVLVMKSTVPVGTGDKVRATLDARGLTQIGYASCPEFLAEGTAVRDFMESDRVVVGSFEEADGEAVGALHQSLGAPIVRMDVPSAEMVKLAANAYLATRISFINEIANVCELVGADVENVAQGMGLDRRIGTHYLRAGIGYGGACFPKDMSFLKLLAGNSGYHFHVVTAVMEVNELQMRRPVAKLQRHLGSLRGKRVALLGLAFKPNTDDLREAPSNVLAARLLAEGADVVGWDPVAEASRVPRGIELVDSAVDAIKGADAAVIVTEWPELRDLPWSELRETMRTPVVIDGRNHLDAGALRAAGFVYEAMGRAVSPFASLPETAEPGAKLLS